MQMFPDDLPLANIDADGYCCHFMRSSVRPTIHGLGFVYCTQSAWKKWPTIWHADVSRWLTLSIHGCLWILLLVCLSVHLSVCSFTAFSGGCAFANKSLGTNGIKFGAKEGGSHYWEMAVAITCGYGGYLLPLLAAHSSFESYQPILKISIGNYFSGTGVMILFVWCHWNNHDFRSTKAPLFFLLPGVFLFISKLCYFDMIMFYPSVLHCVTSCLQWFINSFGPSDGYICHWTKP